MQAKIFERSFVAWGTNLDFIVVSNKEEEVINRAINDSVKKVSELSSIFNNYDPKSEVSLFNKSKKNIEFKMSEHFAELLNLSIKYNKLSGGYFDITIGNVSSEFNYEQSDKTLSNLDIKKRIKDCSGFDKLVLTKINGNKITKSADCLMLDFGGIAEGYALNLILKIFQSYEIKNVLINFGGNISTLSSTKDWFIEIEDLGQQKKILLNNKSISTSSKKSKKINIGKKNTSHIYNFKEKVFVGYEDTTLSVVSKDPIFCDAFSTSLIAMPMVERNAFIKNKKIEIFISDN